MAIIHPGRFAAAHEGPLVVFLIGMRINHFLKIGQWLPVARAMGPMLAELSRDADSGFLGYQPMLAGLRTIMLVQYWRDFEALESYARARDKAHFPAWAAFNKAVGNNGAVGIFHETYAVAAHEAIYANMPLFGLGAVGGITPATGSRQTARSRMKP